MNTTPKLFWEYYPYSKYICEVREPILRDAIDGFFVSGFTYQGKDILLTSKYEAINCPLHNENARRLADARERAYQNVLYQIQALKPKDRVLFLPSEDQIFKYFNIPTEGKEFYKFYTKTLW